ncbi:MAG: hypothetical protein JXR03_08685 [Cyclobacteriaceae bacterium]
MQKRTLLFILVLFISSFTYGQARAEKWNIRWGDIIKTSRRSTLSDIVGYDKTGIYALKKEFKGIYRMGTFVSLEHYDNSMKLTSSSELVLKKGKEKMKYEHIISLNEQLYLFSSLKKEKQNIIYVQTINKKTLQPNKDFKMVGDFSYKGNLKSNAGKFNLRVSRDSSKIMVYYDLPYKENENEKFGFNIFDQNMEHIWSKQITLPYEEGLFSIEDYKVDNEGNVHLLAVIFDEIRKVKRNGDPNYQYRVLSFLDQGEETEEYEIDLEGKFLTDMKIAITDELDIICSGFYSNTGTYSILGTYFIKVDAESKEIVNQSSKEFGIDFITQNMSTRQVKKAVKRSAKGKDVELYRYDLDDIVLRSDGGAILLGEQYFVRSHTMTMSNGNGGTTTTTYIYYYYNDIIVVSISPEGEIEWTKKVPKKQSTVNDSGLFSSYALSIVRNKLYFVFNDDYRNESNTEKIDYAFNGTRGSIVSIVELDTEGNMKKEALLTSKDTGVMTRPKVCEQVSKNEMVLFGQRGKKQQFLKVSFN